MGPIEAELRTVYWDQFSLAVQRMSDEAFRVVTDAAASLGGSYCLIHRWPETMSEAIEAAEALGL